MVVLTPSRVDASPDVNSPRTTPLRQLKLQAATSDARSSPRQILRFRKSERVLHWSIAIPFMVCYASALILFAFFNLRSPGLSRMAVSWAHRIAGAGLIAFPLLTALRSRSDYKLHVQNIRQAWGWGLDDLKWLLLMGAAAVNHNIKLPEQGKFNAAEKLNFMMVMGTYPLFILTGVLLWVPGIHFVPWVAHVSMALLAAPLMLGHIYMALINPSTRVGLSGMISGYVDQRWAKEHYRRWFREHFERPGQDGITSTPAAEPLPSPAFLSCPACSTEHHLTTWHELMELVLELKPFQCRACAMETDNVSLSVEAGEVDQIMSRLRQAGLAHRLQVSS